MGVPTLFSAVFFGTIGVITRKLWDLGGNKIPKKGLKKFRSAKPAERRKKCAARRESSKNDVFEDPKIGKIFKDDLLYRKFWNFGTMGVITQLF